MGRTYRANRNPHNTFDINYSAADILGIIAYRVGHHNKKLEADNLKYNISDRLPSTTFKASRVECQTHAAAIQDLSPLDVLSIYNKLILDKLFEGSFKDFKNFITQWINFLWTCDGYRVD